VKSCAFDIPDNGSEKRESEARSQESESCGMPKTETRKAKLEIRPPPIAGSDFEF